MARMIFVVQTSPIDSSAEDEFNRWYNEIHIPDLLKLPEIVGAARYRLLEGGIGEKPSHRYIAVYESDAENPAAVMAAINVGVQEGRVRTDGAPIDAATYLGHFYERIV